MQVVIEIPDRIHYGIEHGTVQNGSIASKIVLNAVNNGIVLPKGHGDLIDREQVIKSLFDYVNGKKTIGECVDKVKAAIPADREGKYGTDSD